MLNGLRGHVSPETAFELHGYPYGFRLKTTIRYWIEHKPKFGFRCMSQTLNPKTGRWNKPNAGTYSPVEVLTLNTENGHVGPVVLNDYSEEERIAEFEREYGDCLTPEHHKAIRGLRLLNAASKHITYTIASAGYGEPTEPQQTEEERRAIWGRALALGARDLAATKSQT